MENPGQEDKQERILLAAQKLFSERGFHGVSVQEIAREAGVNKALLFYYFESKQKLYISIIREGKRAFFDRLNKRIEEIDDTVEAFREILRTLIAGFYRHAEFARIMLREIVAEKDAKEIPVKEHLEETRAPLMMLIEKGIAQGKFREIDAELFSFSVLGMIHIFFLRSLIEGKVVPEEDVFEHLSSLILDGILLR